MQPTSLPPTFVLSDSIVGKSRYGLWSTVMNQALHFMDSPHCLRSAIGPNVFVVGPLTTFVSTILPYFFLTSNFRRKCFKISCNAFKRPLDDVTSKFRHFIAIKHLVMQWKKKKGKEKRSKLQKIVALFTLYKGTNCLIN